MKKLLLIILLFLFANNSFAWEPANCCPEIYKGLNADKLIKIHFTDLIEDKYTVDVQWFPDNGLAPFLTGPAIITFNIKGDALGWFTKLTGFFHIPNFEVDWEKINSGEVFEMKYSDFKRYSTVKELTSKNKESIWSVGIPFLFEDVNFDRTKELIIVKKRAGQRGTDDYEVYSIDEFGALNSPYNITNSMPYVKFDGFTKFNSEDKTITLYSSGGACGSCYETYQAVVGYKGVKFILIKKIVYDYQDKNGNYIGCHIYTYDVVNGREVLIESQTGPVDEITNTS